MTKPQKKLLLEIVCSVEAMRKAQRQCEASDSVHARVFAAKLEKKVDTKILLCRRLFPEMPTLEWKQAELSLVS